jgi:hypothetical protein
MLNFGVAVGKAKARNSQMQIEMLVVGDDVGIPRSRARKVCGRGIAEQSLCIKSRMQWLQKGLHFMR